MTKLQEVVKQVADIVTAPGVEQAIGDYRPDGKCCVGARLAGALGAAVQGDENVWASGRRAFAEAVGGNHAHVDLLLREAGAGPHPFGPGAWPDPPPEDKRTSVEYVWDNLLEVEELPTFIGVDFGTMGFRHLNCEGSDFTRANLEACYISYGQFQKCSFVNANLPHAYGRGAVMTGANFHGAILTSSEFAECSMDGADFRRVASAFARYDTCDMVGVNFHLANLRNAKFSFCDMKCADFTYADVTGAEFDHVDFRGAIFPRSPEMQFMHTGMRHCKFNKDCTIPEYTPGYTLVTEGDGETTEELWRYDGDTW